MIAFPLIVSFCAQRLSFFRAMVVLVVVVCILKAINSELIKLEWLNSKKKIEALPRLNQTERDQEPPDLDLCRP